SALTTSGYLIQTTINDTQNRGQPIAGAELYVDTPPWRGGTPIALSPRDGAFNTTTEAAQVVLPRPIPAGRHLVLVRGRDSAGNWGAISATWLDVYPSGISGRVYAAD